MRSYIRHPSNIPIDFQLEDVVVRGGDYLKNVSHGGLAFKSTSELPVDSVIRIKIPLVKPVFEAIGRVTWCRPDADYFEIGIEFLDEDDRFRARMVEQICHIEQYKKDVFKKEGRRLTAEQAAIEWINKYAIQFPGQNEVSENG